jgi:predicted acyltransferase
MIGFWFGSILMEKKALEEKMLDLFIPGFSILIIGLLLNYGMPMNKRIWSPSFVLVTCGIGACLQSLLIHFIDRKGSKSTWTAFFESFGVNPLFLYVFSELLAIVFDATGLKHDIYTMLHAIILNGYMASLVYAIIFVLICWAVGYILYKKRIYIKI